MSNADNEAPADIAARWRVKPSVPVAIGVFVAYVVVFIGLTSTSGVAYDKWFESSENAWRSAVLPLVGASLVLLVFLAWARWDGVFKDPARLPMYAIQRVVIVAVVLGILVHFAVVDWGKVSVGLLVPIVIAGVLVGFAEETLFRGVILRALRTRGRSEAWVIVISSLWFGFFHLTNILNGSPAGPTVGQCVMASLLGTALYFFRRWRGLLLLGMIAHGLWDISTFLPARTGAGAGINLGVQAILMLLALIAIIVTIKRDRSTVMTPTGVITR